MAKYNIQGAEALLLSLIEEGVDTIFGYPGGAIIPVYDILYDYRDRLRHILTRHEQGAVHAAQGYARATGKVGVCMATSGPGATNLITGIADAMVDSTPLVCITAQVGTALLGTDAFQEADIISMTIPITKWNVQATTAAEIPGAIAKAFFVASSGRPGPVVVDITKSAQLEVLKEFEYKKCTHLRTYHTKPTIDSAVLSSVASKINRANKPLLIVGQGVKLSGAEQEILRFAKKAQIPIASTLMGLSAVPSDHPLYVGKLGMHGNAAGNIMTQECDLLLAVGMRFSDRVTGDTKCYAPNATKIHIDIDPVEINKVVKVDIGLVADAKEAITELLPLVQEHAPRKEWMQVAKDAYKKEYELVIKKAVAPAKGGIRMGEVVDTIAEACGQEAIIVTDVGQQQMFASRYSKFRHTRSLITSGGLGTMGFGLPAAMGAKLGMPDREVIALLGDGGIQMTIQELGTIMQNRIGVKIVVLNNSYLGMVRQWQEMFMEKRYSFTRLENPDFTEIATAYKIRSRKVENRADLREAIDEMMLSRETFLLEVVVRMEENVLPMVPAGAPLSNIIYE